MTSLQPAPDATREHVASLELTVATRETELAALKAQLHALQTKYLDEIGPLYAELIPIDEAVAEAEIAAGLRAPDEEPNEPTEPGEPREPVPCGSLPSDNLKDLFRDVARAVHPDLSSHHDVDERTRYRRHSLMAEANRAYAERDEDRLRLILRAWQHDPDLIVGDNPAAEEERLNRRASRLTTRLVEIDAEFADLRRSAISQLKQKIDDTRAQGWDLFAEMRRQVEREIAMGRATLAKLERRAKRRG
ncbi:MAG TPA: hypothetical protein VN700_08110 [Vicinamibacterales bacterium]|nr:hypothetical protein [Vicinamibacterales bacterium]